MLSRSVAGSEVNLQRVPELVPEEVARHAGMKLDQSAPLANVSDLAQHPRASTSPWRVTNFPTDIHTLEGRILLGQNVGVDRGVHTLRFVLVPVIEGLDDLFLKGRLAGKRLQHRVTLASP